MPIGSLGYGLPPTGRASSRTIGRGKPRKQRRVARGGGESADERRATLGGCELVRSWLARVCTYGRHLDGAVWNEDTGRSLIPHLRGIPLAYYPEHRFGHAPLAEVQRRGGPDPDAVVGEVVEAWGTAEGVDALVEVLDGPSRTAISMAYQSRLWPRPGGDRVEIITHVWAVDLVAKSLCGGRLVREASAALCLKLTGEVAPRGQWLERRSPGPALPVRRTAAPVTQDERSAARLAEILRDDDCEPFTQEGGRR